MRVKPSARRLSKRSRNSPLRPRTTGASMVKRVPSGRPSTCSTICSADCRRDLAPALGAVRMPDPREQQAQVVVGLGDRAHSGARIAAGGLLIDGDGRREPVDGIDVGLVHLPEELAGVRRERFDVAALALGVERVECQRRLAGTRQACDDDQAVSRERHGDVLEIVLPGAPDDDLLLTHDLTLAGDHQSNKCSQVRPAAAPRWPRGRAGRKRRLGPG